MSYENFDPNDILIQAFSTKPEGNFGPHRIPTGIRAIHLPTGTVVTCDTDRSQHRNRHLALTLLWDQVQGKPTYQQLEATVEAFRATLEYFVSQEFEWNNPNDSMIDDINQLLELTPQHHLREVRAEAGRDAIKALISEESTTLVVAHSGCRGADAGDLTDVSAITVQDAERFVEQYAESVKAGEE